MHASSDAAPQASASRSAVSPEPVMRLASGFMAAKHLFAANELGLFEALADAPTTIDGLAARTGLTRRAARISADAMVALGLLEREGDVYRNSEVAATFLAGRSPADLRPFLRFWDKISYPAWFDLAEALATGPTKEVFELDDELQEVVSAGIEAVLAGPADALPEVFDFTPHRRLLDVGGGTGSWTMAVARRYPHLEATVLELPVPAEMARQRAAAAGLTGRVSAVAGDAMVEELPRGHDVFLLANLVHYWSPETNVALLQRVRRAAEGGSRLLLADFWTDPTHTQPVQAALMAGEFAVHLKEGDVYSVEEVRGWLPEAGWRFVEHVPLAGPQSLVVAEAA
ncbi:MAG: methyltransferase domain-containing protein [Actinobacteria bacterium]|nr:methyltransferase domain-containing protein [Actinomycetota bacterium]